MTDPYDDLIDSMPLGVRNQVLRALRGEQTGPYAEDEGEFQPLPPAPQLHRYPSEPRFAASAITYVPTAKRKPPLHRIRRKHPALWALSRALWALFAVVWLVVLFPLGVVTVVVPFVGVTLIFASVLPLSLLIYKGTGSLLE